MKETLVLVATVEEVKEKLVEDFVDLLSDPGEVRKRLMEGIQLPDLSKMSDVEIAGLAQECDLFRSALRGDYTDCQMVLMKRKDNPERYFRISAPERDKEQDACTDLDEGEYGVCHHCLEKLAEDGTCTDPKCFYHDCQQDVPHPDFGEPR